MKLEKVIKESEKKHHELEAKKISLNKELELLQKESVTLKKQLNKERRTILAKPFTKNGAKNLIESIT